MTAARPEVPRPDATGTDTPPTDTLRPHAALPARHLLLALAVVAIWGSNFVVIKRGLAEWPPFLFAALRFGVSALPLVLFLRRPAIAWWRLAAFGLLVGTGQFALLFYAMRADISPGLASLVVQTQVFFTIGLSVWWRGERVRPLQLVGLLGAVAGMVVIGRHLDASVTALGVALVLLAALSWAGGNLVAQTSGRVEPIAFIAWSSLFAAPPLALLSAWAEGPAAIGAALGHASGTAWAALAWQVIGNSLFGYGAWSWLLARHKAAAITPMALLVPVFGLSASAFWLGEPLQPWKLAAAALVLGGLGLNLLAMRRG